jgi:hypothetical protein
MVDLGLGKYYPNDEKEENVVPKSGLKVLKGFRFTICPLSAGLFLQIDRCSRIIRAENFLETVKNGNKDEI